jgi:ABC-type transport system substrate-binding protein
VLRIPAAALLVLAAMLTTCVLAQGDPNTLTVALSGNVETMDPHAASSRAVPFLENVYEPLVGLTGPTTELFPVLAESSMPLEGGTTEDENVARWSRARDRH